MHMLWTRPSSSTMLCVFEISQNPQGQSLSCRSGSMTLRQVHFASVDIELHARYQPGGKETVFDVDRRIAQRTAVMPPLPEDRYSSYATCSILAVAVLTHRPLYALLRTLTFNLPAINMISSLRTRCFLAGRSVLISFGSEQFMIYTDRCWAW